MRIVQNTTVPDNLFALEGQPAFYQSLNYDPIYICSPGQGLDIFGAREGVATIGVEIRRSISPIQDLRSVRELRKAFRELSPVVVHSHSPKGGLLGMIAARLSGVPVRIYQIHGFPYMGLHGPKRQLLMWTERASCFLADEVISVSSSIRDVAVNDRIAPAKKIRVILEGSSNGVDATKKFDPEQFSVPDIQAARGELGLETNDEVVTFVGRLAHDKGIEELLRAWKVVRKTSPTAKLLLIGGVDARDPISDSLIAEAEEDRSIVVAGKRSDIPLMLALSDVVVLPTYREGFPTVLLEAAAMKKPVIATSVPGCTDAVVDGETGLLIPVREVEPLAQAILKLTRDLELRRYMGDAARARVLRYFLPERVWQGYAVAYDRILANQGLSAPSHR